MLSFLKTGAIFIDILVLPVPNGFSYIIGVQRHIVVIKLNKEVTEIAHCAEGSATYIYPVYLGYYFF